VLRFNTLSYSWHSTDPANLMLPTPRSGHRAVCVLNRYLLCIGGRAAGSRFLPQCNDGVVGGSTDVLDTLTGRWASLPCCLANPRAHFGAIAVGAIVLVCGGTSLVSFGDNMLDSTEVLNATKLPELFMDGPTPELEWTPGSQLNFRHRGFSLAGPIDGYIYGLGLGGAGDHPSRHFERLDVRNLSLSGGQKYFFNDIIDPHGAPVMNWEPWDLELPEVRNWACIVAVERRLVLFDGIRHTYYYEPGAVKWELLCVDLDMARVGTSATSFGCRAN